MEADAQAYDELSRPQYEVGCKFISEVNISLGAKVLDMGCGTGNLTKYIADIVGSDGQTVGIDPDDARIKIAEDKYKEVSHLQFHVSNSVTGFPQDSEPYYDVHISTNAFHWVPNEDKKIYIQKAYECLKPGGQLAILCRFEKISEIMQYKKHLLGFHPLTQDGYHKLFEDFGLFNNVVIATRFFPFRYKSFEIFKRSFKATFHQQFEELDPAFAKKFLIKEDDGTVTRNLPLVSITASKN